MRKSQLNTSVGSTITSHVWSSSNCSLRSLTMPPPSFLPHFIDNGTDQYSNVAQSSKQSSVEGSSDNTIPAPAKSFKPIKSAMRSSRTGLNSIKNRTHRPSQCVPSMPSIKSKGGPPVNTKNGYISPQWGWYISTTPPTPEYLQNSVNTNVNTNQGQPHQVATKNESQQQHADTNRNVFVPSRQQWNPSTTPIREVSLSKPVFNKGNPNYSSGWPTVPL